MRLVRRFAFSGQAEPEDLGLSTERFGAFTDAVFSIAMTLLVLEVHLPSGLAVSDIPEHLQEVLPSLVSYAVSFLTLGVLWTGHQYYHALLRRSDLVFTSTGLLYLLLVALVPFSTGALGEYPSVPLVHMVFGLNLTAATLVGLVNVLYALAPGRLAHPDLDPEVVRMVTRRQGLMVLGYALAAVLAFVSPWLSGILFLVTPLAFIPSRRMEHSLFAAAAQVRGAQEHEDTVRLRQLLEQLLERDPRQE
ncbi:TMEM175 family protein [Deinococcus yavapaiensis]|uniref:Putative membrane protein n=1 Tax=Deinococcus yavapaiensis KR-236 TaxID=694435 RepID=A0A318S445_9DEIO|nr:TMEM175 family protein [Deinococcus yavapaiensis]PYE51818.1 putative membrane protein [Deinococcus yavapaiensis KR-236]